MEVNEREWEIGGEGEGGDGRWAGGGWMGGRRKVRFSFVGAAGQSGKLHTRRSAYMCDLAEYLKQKLANQ